MHPPIRLPSSRWFIAGLVIVLVLMWALFHKGCAGTTTKFTEPTAKATSTVKSTPAVQSEDDVVIIRIGDAAIGQPAKGQSPVKK